MYRSLADLMQYNLTHDEKKMGRIIDVLFNDTTWSVQYLEIDTGEFLPGKKLLISPAKIEEPNWELHSVSTWLTPLDLECAKPFSEDIPVTDQWKKRYPEGAFDLESGGSLSYILGIIPYPMHTSLAELKDRALSFDRHLRSLQEVIGYVLKSTDDEFGQIIDFIVDTQSWEIKHVAADSRRWFFGKKILLSPHSVSGIDWFDKSVSFNMTKDQILSCLEFQPGRPINQQDINNVYDYYGRPVFDEKGAGTKQKLRFF